VLDASGVTRVRFPDLHQTAASMILSKNILVIAISKILDQVDPSIKIKAAGEAASRNRRIKDRKEGYNSIIRSMMLRTYKYLLRPTPDQQTQLDFLLWQSRLVYNAALQQRISTYQETGKGIGYGSQWAHFRDLRRLNPETLGQVNASSLQHLLRRLDKAFSAFFRRIKAGTKAGFPRFKSRDRFKSIEYTYGDGCKLHADEHGRVSLYIQNVGEVRLCYHRAVPKEATLKHAVIKQVNHRWYVCLMLALPDPQPAPAPAKKSAVGIDVGLYHLLALSDGTLVENPRWLRASLARLRVLQRRAARRQKGSQRQKGAYRQVARWQERVANQRRDFWHKLTTGLVGRYDLIGIEDLTLAFMTHNPHLALSAHDAGLALFRQFLEYKAESAGTRVIAVNPAFTSQTCSRCGVVKPKSLSERVHACECGLEIDRDVNAARVILDLVLQKLGQSFQDCPVPARHRDVMWAVAPCMS
jgi:putative transposase